MKYIFLVGDIHSSATSICGYKVCKELSLRGNTIYVVSVGQEEKTAVSLDGKLVTYELSPRLFFRVVYRFRQSKNVFLRLLSSFFLLVNRILIQIKTIVSIKPWLSRENLYEKKVREIISEVGKVDIIIAMVQPLESLIAANKIWKDFKIPYSAYMLDAIYGNNGVRFLPNSIYKRKSLYFENKYLSDAKSIYMVETMADLYSKLNRNRYTYINNIHYVGIPLLAPVSINLTDKKTLLVDSGISILFVGTMPKRIRDPHFTIKLMEGLASWKVNFYIIGRSDHMSEINRAINRSSNIKFLGYVPHDKILHYLKEADILLNIGNSFANMIPSKIFEYMSYGKPIISTSKIPNDPCKKYLGHYEKSIVINEYEPLEDGLNKLNLFFEMIKEKSWKNNETDIIKSLSKYTVSYVCNLLELKQ